MLKKLLAGILALCTVLSMPGAVLAAPVMEEVEEARESVSESETLDKVLFETEKIVELSVADNGAAQQTSNEDTSLMASIHYITTAEELNNVRN